jgi:hypothetical protein
MTSALKALYLYMQGHKHEAYNLHCNDDTAIPCDYELFCQRMDRAVKRHLQQLESENAHSKLVMN